MSQIAIVATGDELVEGEVLNTNGRDIARILSDHGYAVGHQQVCRDNDAQIADQLRLALDQYPITIVIGGLGPTEDDLTRHAIAQVTDKPLVEDADSLEKIQQISRFHNTTLNQPNRQQAFFPKGATVLPNSRGTANGFMLQDGDTAIYALPGPPRECLPMFEGWVLPSIHQRWQPHLAPMTIWRLFGQSESQLAAELARVFPDFAQQLGYRWHYPYLDIKYRTQQTEVIDDLTRFFNDRQICQSNQTASVRLYDYLSEQTSVKLMLHDHATGGALQQVLYNPQTCHRLSFDTSNEGDNQVWLTGLDEYWAGETQSPVTSLEIHARFGLREYRDHVACPNRAGVTPLYVREWASHVIYQWLMGVEAIAAVRR